MLEPREVLDADVREVEDLETFDSQEWTDVLGRMPLTKLYEIRNYEHYQHSLDRVRNLAAALKQIFVGKGPLIDFMCISSIAQLPLLLLGTWGTAKSMLVRKFAEGMGIYPKTLNVDEEDAIAAEILDRFGNLSKSAKGTKMLSAAEILEKRSGRRRHFEYLVTRFTTPEEILGGLGIDLMLNGSIFMRNTRGFLPRAEIVFLDEVFKANSSILNALLSLLNERLLYNAGAPWSANLVMLFGASNEPPQEEDLGAFYDRFPVRALCDPVDHDEKTLLDLLSRSHANTASSLLPSRDVLDAMTDEERSIEKKILDEFDPEQQAQSGRLSQEACPNDLRLLRNVSFAKYGGAKLSDSKKFIDAFLGTYMNLRHQYDVSDRSAGHFYRLALASALYHKEKAPTPTHCKPFAYCSKDPEAARKLPGIVDDLIRV